MRFSQKAQSAYNYKMLLRYIHCAPMHHIPLYGRFAWSSTYTWCTQKSRAADERQRVSDMPTYKAGREVSLKKYILF